jgi:hypothetical protein
VSGNKVMKAFIATDWSFYDATGCLMMLKNLNGLAETPKKLSVTFVLHSENKKIERLGKRLLLLLKICTHIFAQFGGHSDIPSG